MFYRQHILTCLGWWTIVPAGVRYSYCDIAFRIVLQFHMILNDIINLTYDIQIITESKIVQNTSYIADAEIKGVYKRSDI
jgi:hypothetical protein